MNILDIPGFTAKASLRHPNQDYCLAVGVIDTPTRGLVIPQRIKLRADDCNPANGGADCSGICVSAPTNK